VRAGLRPYLIVSGAALVLLGLVTPFVSGHAFAEGRTVLDLSQDIVHGTTRFDGTEEGD
jgi:hypothetical protein